MAPQIQAEASGDERWNSGLLRETRPVLDGCADLPPSGLQARATRVEWEHEGVCEANVRCKWTGSDAFQRKHSSGERLEFAAD